MQREMKGKLCVRLGNSTFRRARENLIFYNDSDKQKTHREYDWYLEENKTDTSFEIMILWEQYTWFFF